jgi:hypothetical protein
MLWLRSFFLRNHLRAERDEEIRQPIAERSDAAVGAGMEPKEPVMSPPPAMGNVSLNAKRSINVWQWRWIESLWADLQYAVHQLTRSPGYAVTAILTLMIGIGANATFSRSSTTPCSAPCRFNVLTSWLSLATAVRT